jgi:hypothetical protein
MCKWATLELLSIRRLFDTISVKEITLSEKAQRAQKLLKSSF